MAPSLGRLLNINMASKQEEIIEVPDDNDFPSSGPQNPEEAQSYRDKIGDIMITFSDLLADDRKDALRLTITSLKKFMVKHWWQMAEANMEVVLKSIHNPSCVYLCQHLTTEGVNVTEPVTEVPEGWTFLRQLPKKVLIVMCFNHLLEVHTHMSSFVANMSSLAKIANPETFDMVMKAAAQLMIQINIPEHYLSPVQDPPLKMTAEECLSQLERVLLPRVASLAQEPWYRPTQLLAAAVWLHLKCKFFNGNMAKEACTMFEVWAKQLSKLLSGKVYLSGTTGATKGKQKQSHTVAHEGDIAGDDPPPHQEVNEAHHHCKSSSLHSSTRRHQTTVSPPSSTAVRHATIVSPHCTIIIIVIHHQHSSTGSTKTEIFMTTPA